MLLCSFLKSNRKRSKKKMLLSLLDVPIILAVMCLLRLKYAIVKFRVVLLQQRDKGKSPLSIFSMSAFDNWLKNMGTVSKDLEINLMIFVKYFEK